jgi:ATP-dependent protease ClpP protease subunit
VTEAGLNVYKELLQQARREMSAHYQAYTKLTAEEIELRMSTEVPYSSEQALEKGIVEKIIGRRPSL